MNHPTIAISMGDPSGIGPEVVVKALADDALRAQARFLIFGLSEQFAYTADLAEVDFPWRRGHHENTAGAMASTAGVIVLDYDELPAEPLTETGPTRWGGRASLAFLEDAISAVRTGLADAIVTAPISKLAWKYARCRFPGHTELLAKRTNTKRYAMMFVTSQLRVVLTTIHMGLLEVSSNFTIGKVFDTIELADRGLRELFGIAHPRIGVCGLNPHAGEAGQFGDEESRIIEPAILMSAEAGVNVTGPFAADAIFCRALEGQFDCVIAMYHDQGLIPIKLLGRNEAVNLTLGLPLIRTSPGHGTAFDIAGKNRANPGSMRAAIQLAIDLARRRAAAEDAP